MKKELGLILITLFMMVGCGGGSGSSTLETEEDSSVNPEDTSDNIDVTPNDADQRPYADSTGHMTYETTVEITGTPPSGGTSTIEGTEEETEVFSNFGYTRRIETFTESTGTFVIPGAQTTTSSSNDHDLIKIIGSVYYKVDFDEMEIERTDLTDVVNVVNALANVVETGDTSQYEEIGTETILGYTCQNYRVESLDGTTCFYRGIPLKTTIDRTTESVDGVSTFKYEQVITDLELNVVLDEGELDLPDYPVINGAQLNSDESNVGTLHLINVYATPPECPDGEGALVVTNDVIVGSVQMDDGSSFEVTGEIGLDNEIYGGFVRDSITVADYTGSRSSTDKLSGTWSSTGDVCYGSWSE